MLLLGRLILICVAALIAFCMAVIGLRFSVWVALICAVYVSRTGGLFRVKRFFTAHGTARWAEPSDLRGMIGAKQGLILGRLIDWRIPSVLSGAIGLVNPKVGSGEACDRFLGALFRKPSKSAPIVRLSNAIHTAVFAPTGVGKGVSCVIPFLLDCRESCVVIDFKGELAKLTMERRRGFGQQVYLLDPFKMVTDSPDCLNPLDSISKDDPFALDHCRDLALSQVTRTGNEKDPHWCDSAELWIAAMLAVAVAFGDTDKSLQSIRDILTDPQEIAKAIQAMCKSDAWDGMLARMGHQLTQFQKEELGGVLTTTNRFTRYLDTLPVAASTSKSSFSPTELLNRRTTVYLVLPPEHARAQSALLRMWISTLLRGVVQGGLQEQTKVHFICDEASSLGKMDQIDDAIDKYRGYGVRMLFLYQSVGQLQKCFPEGQDQTLLSNVSQVFFGVNDWQTAEYVSNRLGEETIIVESGGVSRGVTRQSSTGDHDSSSVSRNVNDNWAQQGRKLLKPEEVMALSPRTAITFAPGVAAICTTLTRYYEENPSLWRYLKRALKTAGIAIALFIGFGVLAMILSGFGAPPPEPRW